MKQLFLLTAMIFSLSLTAQDLQMTDTKSGFKGMLGKFSVTATAGTDNFATDNLKNINLNNISLSQLTIAYKMNSRVSFGISSMSDLGVNAGYYNAENQFFSFCTEDDDDDHDDDDMFDDDMDDDDDEGCDDDDDDLLGLGQNLMGTVTFKLSDKLPFFIQAAGGYSMSNNVPVYSAMIGYNQKLFGGLGIQGGVRFSEVLYKTPVDAVRTTTTTGLKAELGLSWNF